MRLPPLERRAHLPRLLLEQPHLRLRLLLRPLRARAVLAALLLQLLLLRAQIAQVASERLRVAPHAPQVRLERGDCAREVAPLRRGARRRVLCALQLAGLAGERAPQVLELELVRVERVPALVVGGLGSRVLFAKFVGALGATGSTVK